jgi:hypothetical protein
MISKDEIIEIIESYGEETLFADGFDDAIIGIDLNSMRVIYSISKCIEVLMEDMEEIDAIEHFDYNVFGAWVGEKTPIWCRDYC